MNKFNPYEFFAILVPGAVLTYGIALIFPETALISNGTEFSLGSLGLFTILSFTVGTLIQALGNILEEIWWWPFGGKPTDWVRTNRHEILSNVQRTTLHSILKKKLHLDENIPEFEKMSKSYWSNISRQIRVAVKSEKDTKRLEMFLYNYGLYRGLASALLLLAIVIYLKYSDQFLWLIGILLLFYTVSMIRMHRFGEYYAKELYMDFLHL